MRSKPLAAGIRAAISPTAPAAATKSSPRPTPAPGVPRQPGRQARRPAPPATEYTGSRGNPVTGVVAANVPSVPCFSRPSRAFLRRHGGLPRDAGGGAVAIRRIHRHEPGAGARPGAGSPHAGHHQRTPEHAGGLGGAHVPGACGPGEERGRHQDVHRTDAHVLPAGVCAGRRDSHPRSRAASRSGRRRATPGAGTTPTPSNCR